MLPYSAPPRLYVHNAAYAPCGAARIHSKPQKATTRVHVHPILCKSVGSFPGSGDRWLDPRRVWYDLPGRAGPSGGLSRADSWRWGIGPIAAADGAVVLDPSEVKADFAENVFHGSPVFDFCGYRYADAEIHAAKRLTIRPPPIRGVQSKSDQGARVWDYE